MFKKMIIMMALLSLMLAVTSANAQWTWVKEIDCTTQVQEGGAGCRMKDVIGDSSGNIYFTQYFGTPSGIYKIASPLTATPTITKWVSLSYASSNGATMAFDASGNMYFLIDGTDTATTYIKKFDSTGNPVTSFGTNGTLSPVVMGGADRRLRDICWTGAATNKLLVSTFGTPYQVGVLNASTGADGGALISAFSDQGCDGTVTDTNSGYMGMAYNTATSTIYGNAFANLVFVSGTSPSLTDLTTFNTYLQKSCNTRLANSGFGLDFDSATGFIAYSPTANSVGVYDITAGTQVNVGATVSTDDGYINGGAAPAFFRSGSDLYLAVVSYYDNAIEIYKYSSSSVGTWNLY